MDINTNIFRAYDIRGVAYEDLTEELVSNIGKSLGTSSLNRGENLLIVARDGRNSSSDMYEWLSGGIRSTGCNVLNIGIVPTPLLYFSTFKLSSSSGVMITGSHNPPEYNGFKIVRDNKTISGETIQEVKLNILENKFLTGKGLVSETEIVEMYSDELRNNIDILRPVKLAIDCGNGAASILAKAVYESLGCEVESIYSSLDGNFPNHHPDPSNPENLKDLIKVVQDNKLEIGLAFDGDADRLGVVSSKGEIIYPDMQMILFSREILANQQNCKIVFDVKCSKLLSDFISKEGGIPIMSRTGHPFIKDTIVKESALLGGEMSGHIFFNDKWPGFDDAIYAGARMLEIISRQSDKEDIFSTLPNLVSTPEINVKTTDKDKFNIVEEFKNLATFPDSRSLKIDGIRIEFDYGWGLLRASNTTPNLVLRFEANNKENLESIKNKFKEVLSEIDSNLSKF
tara:strand:- start:1022 stop:2389 length:1368 start_codon:yes stop_codon:yes gene_type:complete